MKTVISFAWKLGILAILGFVYYWWSYIPQWVYENGITAPARVIESWPTSTMVNEEPVGGLRLDVRPRSGEAFQVKKYCRVTYYYEWLFQEGVQVEVKYSPRYPGRTVIASAPCDLEMSSILNIALIVIGSIVVIPLLISIYSLLFGASRLEEIGLPARATVLHAEEAGWTLNDNPGVKLDLQVYPPGDLAYPVKTTQVVSPADLERLYPGAEVEVKIHPRRRNRLLLTSMGARQEVDITDRLEKLEGIHQRRLISDEEYQRLREGILKSI